jgi:hypothetical protein
LIVVARTVIVGARHLQGAGTGSIKPPGPACGLGHSTGSNIQDNLLFRPGATGGSPRFWDVSFRRPLAVAVGALVIPLGFAQAASAQPQPGAPSNLGLCSSYLAQLPSPPGVANVRALVNHLIIDGGYEVSTPGELYSQRAHEHPTDSAQQECLKRPQDP